MLFPDKPGLIGANDLSKLHFVGIQRVGQIIHGDKRRPVVERLSAGSRGAWDTG